MRSSPTRGVLVAAALVVTGCGGGERSQPADRAQSVKIVRVAFPERQHLAQRSTFAITVRNAGDRPIASVVGTLRGLSARAPDGTDTKLWIAGEGDGAAIGDARASGALDPGDEVTLRWHLTASAPGTHELSWEIAGGDKPRGTLTVHVAAKPPFARVDPRTGRVVREESAPSG